MICRKSSLGLLILFLFTSCISDIYKEAKDENNKPVNEIRNIVREIYRPFCPDEISKKISSMLRSEEINAQVEIVFQSIEGLHEACPGHTGDWYFTGNYPTPGGNKVANQSFINYIEGRNVRAY
jgi:amidophosphoribosyltransferase